MSLNHLTVGRIASTNQKMSVYESCGHEKTLTTQTNGLLYSAITFFFVTHCSLLLWREKVKGWKITCEKLHNMLQSKRGRKRKKQRGKESVYTLFGRLIYSLVHGPGLCRYKWRWSSGPWVKWRETQSQQWELLCPWPPSLPRLGLLLIQEGVFEM